MRKIAFILLVSLLLGGCGSVKSEANENYKVTEAKREVFIFAGKIQTNNSTDLASKIAPSKVSKVNVDVGSKVNAGDPIIYLDTTDLEQQVKQAEAKVTAARAALSKVQGGARSEDIAMAEARVSSDEKAYENAGNNYSRIKQLYDNGYDTKQNLEQVETALTTAKNNLAYDKENLNKLSNGSTKQEIDVAKATVNEAEAGVNYYETELSNGVIKSPISGTVSVCNIHEGEIAATGITLVTIVNNDDLYIDGYVPEDILSQIKVGQEMNITVSDISDKRFKGEVSIINPVMNSNNKNIVRVTLKEGNDVLKPGMIAEIGFSK